jgi:hypothetical protein
MGKEITLPWKSRTVPETRRSRFRMGILPYPMTGATAETEPDLLMLPEVGGMADPNQPPVEAVLEVEAAVAMAVAAAGESPPRKRQSK